MSAGTLSLSATGKGLAAANITGLANLGATFSVKWVQKVDELRTLGAAGAVSSCAVGFLDSDGANSNHKMALGWAVSAAGLLNLKFHIFGGNNFNGPQAAYTVLPAAGSYIVCEIDSVSGTQHYNVYSYSGGTFTQISGLSGSGTATGSLPTSGSPGVFTLNEDNSASVFSQQATAYGGIAWYNTVLTGANVYNAPTSGDSGIQAAWLMEDAASGSTPTTAAALVGGQVLNLTNNTWLSDTSPWASTQVPTSATITPSNPSIQLFGTQQFTGTILDASNNPIVGEPVTWTESSGGVVGTVSNTGLFTSLATGTSTVKVADVANSNVSASTTITVSATTVASPSVSSATAVGSIVALSNVINEQAGNAPFTSVTSLAGVVAIDATLWVSPPAPSATAVGTITLSISSLSILTFPATGVASPTAVGNFGVQVFTPVAVNSFAAIAHLDRKIYSTTPGVSSVYNSPTDTTTWFLPYAVNVNQSSQGHLTVARTDLNIWFEDTTQPVNGSVLVTRPTPTSIAVSGLGQALTSVPVVIGVLYTSSFQLTTIYERNEKGGVEQRGRLRLGYLEFSYEPMTNMTVTVTPQGRSPYLYTFSDPTAQMGSPFEIEPYRIPVQCRNEDCTIVVSDATPGSFRPILLDWEGDLSLRSRAV